MTQRIRKYAEMSVTQQNITHLSNPQAR
jgi:hypothetical protein